MARPRTEAANYQTVTIRFPKDLLEDCRERALQQRRSLNAELVLMIESYMRQQHASKKDVHEPVYS